MLSMLVFLPEEPQDWVLQNCVSVFLPEQAWPPGSARLASTRRLVLRILYMYVRDGKGVGFFSLVYM